VFEYPDTGSLVDDNACRPTFHPHCILFNTLKQWLRCGQQIRVFKRGYVTGLTGGYLHSLSSKCALPGGHTLSDAVCVKWHNDHMFTQDGDSGSLYYIDWTVKNVFCGLIPLAIHVAAKKSVSFGCWIDVAFNVLGSPETTTQEGQLVTEFLRVLW